MTPEFYALIGLGVVVIWQGGLILQAMRIAAVERRKDHEEMLAAIENVAKDIANIEMFVGGIDNKINPPDLSAYD